MAATSEIFDLSGKIACVTGASSGLGRHAATILAERGACVIGVARREDQLDDWQRQTSGQTSSVVWDISRRSEIPHLAKEIVKPFGPPDILIHAAGINNRQKADDVTGEDWDMTFSINLGAPFFLSQQLVPYMKDKGWGRIVNFASLQTFRAFPNGISYGTTKAGVAQMTRAMAECWSEYGINVNAIGPGFFKTELTTAVFNDPQRAQRNAEQTCIGRNGKMSDMDGPLIFLCSEASSYVTGQILMVDGGFTAK